MTIHIPTALAVFFIIIFAAAILLGVSYLLMLEWHAAKRKVPQYDELTGLYSRGTMELHITHCLNRLQKTELRGQVRDAFLILDLDGFKQINDTYGHPSGDQLLAGIAKLLLHNTRNSDLVGRMGGDEFILYMARVQSREHILKKADQLIRLIQESTTANPDWGTVTASIGIALVPAHGATFDDLYSKADTALYEAKENGKNQYAIYQDTCF